MWRRWASTFCTCRRSIPSAARIAKVRTTRRPLAAGDVGSPWAIGSEDGGHKSIHPELGTIEDFRRLVPPRRSTARVGDGHRVPMLARPSLRARASRVVPQAARRHDPVRREPAEEISGHLSVRFRNATRGSRCGRSCKSMFLFWIDEGVRIFRVDNPHTKPFRVLGMGDRRSAPRTSRRDLSRRSIHAAEGDVSAGEGGLLAVVHLLRVARHEVGAHAVLHRAARRPSARVLSPEPLAEHARHPAGVAAGRRPRRLHDAARARRHALRQLRHLRPAVRARLVGAARAGQRRVSRLGKISSCTSTTSTGPTVSRILSRA